MFSGSGSVVRVIPHSAGQNSAADPAGWTFRNEELRRPPQDRVFRPADVPPQLLRFRAHPEEDVVPRGDLGTGLARTALATTRLLPDPAGLADAEWQGQRRRAEIVHQLGDVLDQSRGSGVGGGDERRPRGPRRPDGCRGRPTGGWGGRGPGRGG